MTLGESFVSVRTHNKHKALLNMKPAFFLLLSIYAGTSVALAQVVSTALPVAPRPYSAPEIDWTVAAPALILLAGVIAIVRGRRSR